MNQPRPTQPVATSMPALLAASGFALVLDAAWIYNFALPLYQATPGWEHTKSLSLTFAVVAILVYTFIIGGLWHFVWRNPCHQSIAKSALNGGILGMVIYGTFTGTVFVAHVNWTLYHVATDTLWGMALCASTSACYAWAAGRHTRNA